MEICLTYISKIMKKNYLNDPKQRKRRLVLPYSKKVSALLERVTSKYYDDSYSLIFLHSFRTKNKLKTHEKVCKSKDFCRMVLSFRKDNILKFNQYIKSDKAPCVIYEDLESLIKKIDGCGNNPKKSLTVQVVEHNHCRYSVSTIWKFENIENKHSLFRGEQSFVFLWESMQQI